MFNHAGIPVVILRPVVKKQEPERRPVKTTVELPGELWRAAKIRAMDERADLRTIFIRALESYLGMPAREIAKRGRNQGQ